MPTDTKGLSGIEYVHINWQLSLWKLLLTARTAGFLTYSYMYAQCFETGEMGTISFISLLGWLYQSKLNILMPTDTKGLSSIE